ncbi:hypothetical protein ACI65C_013683 [Semiaphis heraclei]
METKYRGGPKPKIPHDLVFQALEDIREELFDLDGKLVPCTSNIWTTICDNLDNKITAKNLYISVYQNRHSWLSRLKSNTKSSFIKHSDSINIESDEKDEESSKSVTSSSSFANSNEKRFSIEIPYKKFIKMNPIKVIYCNQKHKKQYTVLKPGVWTNIINDEFLKNYKMPCTYVYRRCRVAIDSSRSNHYLTFQAKCKDCGVLKWMG